MSAHRHNARTGRGPPAWLPRGKQGVGGKEAGDVWQAEPHHPAQPEEGQTGGDRQGMHSEGPRPASVAHREQTSGS